MIVEGTIPRGEELERLIDALPGAVVKTRDEIVVYCNRTFATLMGEEPEALAGRTIWSLIAPEHVERAQLRYVQRQRGGPVPDSWEFDLLRSDGGRVHVEAEPRALEENEHLILMRDRAGALHDIELANRLSALALRLQRERSVEAVLRTAASGLLELGMSMQAFEYRSGEALAFPGHETDFTAAYTAAFGTPFSASRYTLESVPVTRPLIEEGRPIYVDDSRPLVEEVFGAALPAAEVEKLAAATPKRLVLAPLFMAERPWGALAIGASTLSSRDAATIALFTSQVASAMEIARTIDELNRANRGLQAIQADNDRLYRETRRRLDLLSVQYGLSRAIAGSLEEQPLADRALELLTERLDVDGGWVYAKHDEELRLVGVRFRGAGDLQAVLDDELGVDRRTACGNALLDRSTVVLDLDGGRGVGMLRQVRALGMRHIVAVPLLVEDEPVGTLSLAGRGPDPFDDETLQLIESCAVQLAVALERSRLFADERRRVRDLSRLNELGNLISQHLELPALLSLGIDHVQRLVEVPQVLLALLDPDGGPLRVVATNVREPGVLGIVTERNDASVAAAAVRELRPVLIEDPLDDPRSSRALAVRFGHKALLGVPLISRGEPIGAITFCETREGKRFTEAAIERAVAVANQLAAAIANARLFEEERHRVHELSLLSELGRIASGTLQRDVLLAECLGQIRGALSFESGAAYFVHRGRRVRAAVEGGDLDGAAARRMEELATRALAAGKPISHAEDGVHTCALPLLAGPQASGVLVFARHHRPVSDANLRTLAAAAPELAVALQNARLYDEARRRVEELRLLLDIGRAITGSLDLDGILETSAGILSRIIDGSNAFILLLDAAAGELRGSACSNPAWRDDFRDVRISLTSEASVTAHCMRSRTPVAVTDLAASPYAASPMAARFGEQSVLALPLLVRDEPIGCVVVDDTRAPRDWSAPEIERAALIAHQLAVAVANARLYDDLKRSYGELARTQEELVKRERLAALGELSAVVAHEVRNPLGVIFNSLGSMRKLLRPTGDGAMLLDIVEEEADRLDRIVRDLLDFARPNEPNLEAERLDELLADTLQAAQGDRVPAGVEVELELAPDLPPLRIDARMIRQVLLNLVLNGMQAMPRGGTLRIRAAREPGDGKLLRIEVIDQGTGVPQELAPRIFQPFFTTKAAGTGLGLAVVKRFVDAHGGSIHFHSRQGEGTTFTLRLPVDEAE